MTKPRSAGGSFQLGRDKAQSAPRPCLAVFFLAAFFLFAHAPALVAAPEHFVNDQPALALKNGRLQLNLAVSVDDEDGLRDILRQGATVQLEADVTVERKRSFWKNEGIENIRKVSLLKYDPLTRNYRMTQMSGGNDIHGSNLRQLLARSWKQLELPVLDAGRLQKDEAYSVIVKLSLRQVELPSVLENTLLFWSRDVVEPLTVNLDYRLDDAVISR